MLAVVANVVATPLPTPEVITKTVTETVVPAWVGQLQALLQQLGLLALLLVPGTILSKLHDWLLNDKLGKWANALLLFAYSAVWGVVALWTAGQLDLTKVDWHNPEVVGAAIFAVIGAASARYAIAKAQEADVLNPQPEPPNRSVQF